MDEILQSHCIALEKLRSDDFWGFFETRAEELLRHIEAAMGKRIAREPELFKPGVVVESYGEDTTEEWETEESLEAV